MIKPIDRTCKFIFLALVFVAASSQSFASTTASKTLYNSAVADYKAERFLLAQTEFMQVLAYDPAESQCDKFLLQIPYMQGMKLLKEQKFADAETYLRLAANLQPANLSIRSSLIKLPFQIGKEKYEKGKYSEALSHFRRYSLARPQDGLAHYYIANCLAKTGDIPSAYAEYQNAIQLNPASSTAAYASAALQKIAQGVNAVPNAQATPSQVVAVNAQMNPAPLTWTATQAGITYQANGAVAAQPNQFGQQAVPIVAPNALNNGLQPQANVPTTTVYTPALPVVTPVTNMVSSNDQMKQAAHSIQTQSMIDASNSSHIAQAWQNDSATTHAIETGELARLATMQNQQNQNLPNTRKGYNTQYAQPNSAIPTTEFDDANRAAILKNYSALSWQASHSNLVNQSANNLQDLLADPASGLQSLGTDLYTRYYGPEPGKVVPEAHHSVARIVAGGSGGTPEYTTDDDQMTMRKAPPRDVSGRIIP